MTMTPCVTVTGTLAALPFASVAVNVPLPAFAAVIKQYTEKYPTITDAEAKAMAEQMFDCEARLAELKKSYFKKFNKALPALVVTKFFQLDHRLDLAVDMEIESSLPPLTQAQKDDKGNPEGIR